MDLHHFNHLSALDADSLLSQCVHIPTWVFAISGNRPFASLHDLYRFAETQSQRWTWLEVKTALAQHPRIGEKQAEKKLTEKEQAFSNKEQGQMQVDEEIRQKLYQGNVDYESRFDHIFLIRAAGRSSTEVLSEIERRLQNDTDTERLEVAQQLAEIALLRLKQEIQ